MNKSLNMHVIALLLCLIASASARCFADSTDRMKNAVSMYNLGLNAMKQGSLESAIIFFRRACDINPQLADAQYNLGVLYQSQNKHKEALERFEQALTVKPGDPDATRQIASCKKALGLDLPGVNRQAENAGTSTAQGESAASQSIVSSQGVTHDESTKPTDIGDSATSVNPQAVGLYNLGLTALRQGSRGEVSAIIFFKRACDIDPRLSDAQYNLAVLYQSQKRHKEAIERFEQVLTVKPGDPETLTQIAVCRKALGLGAVTQSEAAGRAQRESSIASQTMTTSAVHTTDQSPQAAVVSSKNTPVKDKWALVIGISKFSSSKNHPGMDLKYAAKDAQDFYNYLTQQAKFPKDHVLLLLNERATRRNIMSAFGAKFLPAVVQPGDQVVIYVSTHGTPANKDPGKRNFIVAYDTEPDSLYETGVNMDELYGRVKEGVKTDRALIVMDTCFSGAGIPGARGVDDVANFDAAQIAQGFGHLVVSSSAPNERSWESKVSQNGVFTKYLIQNLQLTKGNLKQAFEKLTSDVQWEVQNAFNQSQHPKLGGQWEGTDFNLSVVPGEHRPILNPDLIKFISPVPLVPPAGAKTK